MAAAAAAEEDEDEEELLAEDEDDKEEQLLRESLLRDLIRRSLLSLSFDFLPLSSFLSLLRPRSRGAAAEGAAGPTEEEEEDARLESPEGGILGPLTVVVVESPEVAGNW